MCERNTSETVRERDREREIERKKLRVWNAWEEKKSVGGLRPAIQLKYTYVHILPSWHPPKWHSQCTCGKSLQNILVIPTNVSSLNSRNEQKSRVNTATTIITITVIGILLSQQKWQHVHKMYLLGDCVKVAPLTNWGKNDKLQGYRNTLPIKQQRWASVGEMRFFDTLMWMLFKFASCCTWL